ncbi:NAD(P)H-binding protein [Allomuricauda sp. SCSIO 65647]|uniref:NAD(P)H-binding protein n=1 Tax=Allomuricauda sp. SCSIO 65647 TaxID=2908843 RepID=UPI001F23996A|nr:NAD(P)H-binding protein [Muricauda sp. SCSIO 65647]UJH67350.1 NAD(P)H-binding protein [Muricauda sp. SCSIO 65647]
MKKVIIAGASGMIGNLIVECCLASSEIAQVTSLVRKKTGDEHHKLKEVIIDDFGDYSAHADIFKQVDTAFFCIGVYTGQVPDAKFKEITVNYAVAFAEAVKVGNPNARLCLLSGAGADRTEKSRTSFARYKGMAENRISELGLKFHAFRPGYIYPVTPRKEPNVMYRMMRFLYPLIRLGGSSSSIKSTELATAMFRVGMNGADTEILENKAILSYC